SRWLASDSSSRAVVFSPAPPSSRRFHRLLVPRPVQMKSDMVDLLSNSDKTLVIHTKGNINCYVTGKENENPAVLLEIH
ncbi:hypothetical protein S245_001632, partial [Arachis hypogaea]